MAAKRHSEQDSTQPEFEHVTEKAGEQAHQAGNMQHQKIQVQAHENARTTTNTRAERRRGWYRPSSGGGSTGKRQALERSNSGEHVQNQTNKPKVARSVSEHHDGASEYPIADGRATEE